LLLELLPGQRRRIHLALAAGLDRSRVGALAYHWDAAGSAAEALEWSVAAALEAANANGFAEATRLFDQAFGWWDQLRSVAAVQERTRVDVLELAAGASVLSGDRRRALAWLEQALALAEHDPVERQVRLLARLSTLHRESGDVAAAETLVRRAFALDPAPESPEWTQLKIAEAARLFITSDHDAAVIVAAEARAAARARGSAEEEAEALFVLAAATTFSGDVEAGLALAADHIRVAEAAAYARGIVGGHFTDGFVRQAALRWEEAAAVFDRGVAIAKKLHLERWLGGDLLSEAAEARRRGGQWKLARQQLDESLLEFEPAGTEERVVRALLAVGMGDLDVASADLEVAGRRLRQPLPWVDQTGKYFCALAELELLRARPAAALEAAREGIERIGQSRDVRWLGDLSAVALRAAGRIGSAIDAEDLLKAFRNAAAAARAAGNIFTVEVDAHEALIEAELATMAGGAAPEVWVAVAEAWERLREPFPTAYASMRAGERFFATRRRREGRRLLARAHAIAAELGARPLLEEIRRLDGTFGPPNDHSPELARLAASLGLTARETQLLGMLADAPSDGQIAEELVISPKTVSVHVSNLKAKVGVETRAELVRVAVGVRSSG
jgi:DNA-binding CsgD family transcriptional regulator/tetratricopeptide (TPR) repeat protein